MSTHKAIVTLTVEIEVTYREDADWPVTPQEYVDMKVDDWWCSLPPISSPLDVQLQGYEEVTP